MYLSKGVKSHLEACVCRNKLNKQTGVLCMRHFTSWGPGAGFQLIVKRVIIGTINKKKWIVLLLDLIKQG